MIVLKEYSHPAEKKTIKSLANWIPSNNPSFPSAKMSAALREFDVIFRKYLQAVSVMCGMDISRLKDFESIMTYLYAGSMIGGLISIAYTVYSAEPTTKLICLIALGPLIQVKH